MTVVLEFTFLSVLGWGVWAAALATCTGMFLCALLAMIPFFRGKTLLRFCRPRFSARMIRQIGSCGSPNFLNNIAGRITSILMNTILVRVGGETAVSVYGILMYADGLFSRFFTGCVIRCSRQSATTGAHRSIPESARSSGAALRPVRSSRCWL